MSIPNGTYRARALPDDVQFGYTKGGNEQIAVPVQITEGEHAGAVVTWFGTFAEGKATEITLKALRACGWSTSDLTDLAGLGANEVEAVIEWETYNGVDRMKVKWLNTIGGGKVKLEQPMTDAQRKAFAARMKGAALAIKPVPVQTPAASSKARTNGAPPRGAGDSWEPPVDDDLPL